MLRRKKNINSKLSKSTKYRPTNIKNSKKSWHRNICNIDIIKKTLERFWQLEFKSIIIIIVQMLSTHFFVNYYKQIIKLLIIAIFIADY